MATGVVQLHTSTPPKHNAWQMITTGVVCLTRDSERRSYFIQVYTLEDKVCVWEQKFDCTLVPKLPAPYFITFEADNCVAGLNFSAEEEANNFYSAIIEKIREKEKKHGERKKNQKGDVDEESSTRTKLKLASKKKGPFNLLSRKSKKQPALVIGAPQEFRHVMHIGFDSERGFDLEKCDDSWKKLFSTLGVSSDHLTNVKTSKFIYDFVEDHGGIENMVKEIDSFEQTKNPIPTVTFANGADESIPTKPPPPPIAERRKVESKSKDDAPTAQTDKPRPPVRKTPSPERDVSGADETSVSGNLLDQIHQGIRLKKTAPRNDDEPTIKKGSSNENPENGMVGVLAQRLAAMRMNVENDSDDEEDDSEDEWDD